MQLVKLAHMSEYIKVKVNNHIPSRLESFQVAVSLPYLDTFFEKVSVGVTVECGRNIDCLKVGIPHGYWCSSRSTNAWLTNNENEHVQSVWHCQYLRLGLLALSYKNVQKFVVRTGWQKMRICCDILFPTAIQTCLLYFLWFAITKSFVEGEHAPYPWPYATWQRRNWELWTGKSKAPNDNQLTSTSRLEFHRFRQFHVDLRHQANSQIVSKSNES